LAARFDMLRPSLRRTRAPTFRCGASAALAPALRLGGPARSASSDAYDSKVPWPPFVEDSLRGVGQVCFLNSPGSGAITLAALAVGDPWLCALGSIGTLTATASARAVGIDATTVSSGLSGYNGCLVGCAFSVFLGLPPGSPLAVAATVGGSAATVLVASSLNNAAGTVPQWTLAFNFVTLSALTMIRPLAAAPVASAASAAPESVLQLPLLELLSVPLVGVSQIFVVNHAATGAGLIAAIAWYSPALAAHTLSGSAIGALTGLALGAPAAEVAMGLWGFNSALTSLAVGVFFVHSPQVLALSAGGSAGTAVLFGGMKTAAASAFGVPALTLPFCAVASGCYLLRGLPGLALAASPHSPEKNA